MTLGENLKSGLANKNTTAAGVATAIAIYSKNVGGAFPSNSDEWFTFFISVAIAVLGILAKDANIGSQPK